MPAVPKEGRSYASVRRPADVNMMTMIIT